MTEVSVVIPTYNCARYVAGAVESALGQTAPGIEVIVVDDGSTDETAEVMSRFDGLVRYVRQENAGVAVARNRGVAEARGRYLAFLDADDAWYPEKVERQLDALCASSGCRASYSALMVSDADLRPVRRHLAGRRGSSLEDLLFLGNVVGTPSSVLCDRGVFLEAGGFDPELSQCADWEMWVRIAALTEFAVVPEPMVLYRVHGGNMSRNIPLLEADSVRVLEKGFGLGSLPERLRAQRRRAIARNYMVLAGSYFAVRRIGGFARCATRAIALDPRQLGYLAAFPIRRIFRAGPAATEVPMRPERMVR